MFKKIAIATALIASLGTAHAYQAEINASYENTDIDHTDGVDTFGISGKYYLNIRSLAKVNLRASNSPFQQLNSFLDQSVSVYFYSVLLISENV